MKKLIIAGAVSFCALFAAAALNAQMGGGRLQVPTPQGIFNPVVGSGAQYEIQKGDGTKIDFQIAIVGKEAVAGKDGYWFETAMDEPRTGHIVMKSLMVVDGANAHVEKLVMQMPGRGPMEFDGMLAGRMPQAQQQQGDIRDKATDVGSESVTVPAGTFTCEHYKFKDGTGDVWISKDVPPYGMVKMQDKDQSIVLVKALTDAQDQITGTPQPFNPAMMGRGPQQ